MQMSMPSVLEVALSTFITLSNGCTLRALSVSMKRQIDEPEHVDGSQKRRQKTDHPQQCVTAHERAVQNLVLAEEARKSGNAGYRQSTDDERPVRHRQLFSQTTHPAEILLPAQRVDHRTRSQEEQRFEECV